MMGFITGYWVSQAVGVVAQLGVADQLSRGPRRPAAIADRIGADPDALNRLMRALASKGLLKERRDGKFALTKIGEALRSDTEGSMRDMVLFIGHRTRWEDWGNLMHSVQTGEPSVDKLRGMPFFAYLDTDPELAEVFNNAMTATSGITNEIALGHYDFTGFTLIADVGGGHGALLSTILRRAPQARGLLYDLPSVVEGADATLKAAGVAGPMRSGRWLVPRTGPRRRRRLHDEEHHSRLGRRLRADDSAEHPYRDRAARQAAAGDGPARTGELVPRISARHRDAQHRRRQGAHPRRVREPVRPGRLPADPRRRHGHAGVDHRGRPGLSRIAILASAAETLLWIT